MIKYKVVQSNSVEELQDLVMSLLKEGWQCQGGVASSFWLDTAVRKRYSQAMILDEDQLRQWKEMII